MKYGNYCGPYWSNGRIQRSVVGDLLPVDEFDETCRDHDATYAVGGDLREADLVFANKNIGNGIIRTIAGAAVGLQGLLRPVDNTSTYSTTPPMNNKKNLRGSAAKPKMLRGNDSVSFAPTAIATKRTGAAPRTRTLPGGVIEVTHRAFVQVVNSSSPFAIQMIATNPGLAGSFPWLSKLASRFDQYQFKRLRYEYRSVCATSAAGVTMMSYDYDAADEAPTSKAIQAQSVPNSECNVWMSNDLVVPPPNEWRYVRRGALPPNLDIKTYDAGQLGLSVVYGDGAVVGELYVDYTVQLRHPTEGSDVGGSLISTTTNFTIPFWSSSSIVGKAFPFVRTSDNTLNCVVAGEFLVVIRVEGSGISAVPANFVLMSTPGSGSVVQQRGTCSQATRSITAWRMRLVVGDVLSLANVGTGTTVAGVTYMVASTDYDSIS